MRIARFARDGQVRYGQVVGDEVRLIEGDILGDWRVTDASAPLADVRLLAPVTPPNIIAIGLNYRAHAQESGHALPERPVIFIKATTALCDPGQPIQLPRVAPDEVDYECELAIVIGKRAKHVSEADALDYVLGYTCSNDVSARDCQTRLDRQWARGKSFDTFAPLGPWIETDLAPDNVGIRTRLNGETMQDSTTNDLIFGCRTLVSYISDSFTLLPGTVIMTGTPSGVGFARKTPVFLRPGDLVEIEIDGIGVLRNPVIAEP
jgi:2-keto-4-pentenoate hydratase/2-oxohepta-3-ene-1,7-dioic acid hydratase in catechol pathway